MLAAYIPMLGLVAVAECPTVTIPLLIIWCPAAVTPSLCIPTDWLPVNVIAPSFSRFSLPLCDIPVAFSAVLEIFPVE